MSQSTNSDLLRRKIDWNYSNMKRSSALRWSIVNAIVLIVFVYDLSCKCSGHTSLLHYVELALAAAAGASLAAHAARLLPPRAAGPAAPRSPAAGPRSPRPAPADGPALSLSLSPRWRGSPPPAADRSPPSPPPPAAGPPADEFIADRGRLAAYLQQCARVGEQRAAGGAAADGGPRAWPPAPPPQYALAPTAAEAEEEAAGGGGGGGGGGGAAPQLWRRVHLDPTRLTQFNLNLRLWIHVTILSRLAAALEAADGALAAAGSAARVGDASVERLRRATQAPALLQLLPFLEPFADQRYLVGRLRELAAGGCLSSYRWCGGGAGWTSALPTDAELLLHVVATYLDAQLPAAASRRPFTAAHVSAAPAPAPRGPGALALHRARARPPHYVLVLGEDTLEVGAGRNNLLHALLLFVAVCAQRRPPALQRLHLGPAGLNMLWIIGR